MRRLILLGTAFLGACLCAQAQWLNEPTPGAPRTPDGKVNMTGPVSRVNGKPDLSGIWQVEGEPRVPGGLFGIGESTNSKYFRDDRKSTRLNSSHLVISYAVFCLKKKKK